jgi:small subunit ribosomal protein S20
MPVTKTAKRALRSSKRKALVNNRINNRLEIAIRSAKKSKTIEKIRSARALADRAAKKKLIHKNKASRIKSVLAKLLPKTKIEKASPKAKKSSSKK